MKRKLVDDLPLKGSDTQEEGVEAKKKEKERDKDMDPTSSETVPPPKIKITDVPKSFLLGMATRRSVWPSGSAAYFDYVSHGTLYNRHLTKQREAQLNRYYKTLFFGYESVLERKTSTTEWPTRSSYGAPSGSNSNYSNYTSNFAVRPKPSAPSSSSGEYSIGTDVVVKQCAELTQSGGNHLLGRKGKIFTPPRIDGNRLCAVMFTDTKTIHHVPLAALQKIAYAVSTTTTTTTTTQQQQHSSSSTRPSFSSSSSAAAVAVAASSSPSSSPPPFSTCGTSPSVQLNNAATKTAGVLNPPPFKVEHSFQMHQLMQDQFREVQSLQRQYAEARMNNTNALPQIQASLSALRNRHLMQIQMLKQRQMQELVAKRQ